MDANINSIDLSFFSLLLLLVLSAIFFLNAKHGKRKSRPNLPPGSMGWPFVGETLAFLKQHPSNSLGRYLENHINRYGKIFKSNIMGGPTIVSADARFNQFILQNGGRLFEPSYPANFMRIFGEWAPISLTGERHKEIRSVALKFLSGDKLRTHFLLDVEQLALRVINTWKDGLCLSAKEEAEKFTFYLMAKNVLSMEPGKPETEKMRRAYANFMPGVVSMPLKFPGTLYWKALKSRSEIHSEIERKMDSRMNEMIKGDMKENNDLLGWCLTELNLPTEQILDFLLNIVFGGFDTTSAALSLAILFLGHCPKAFQELRDEHLRIARKKIEKGETNLNWEDYKEMKFTECVMKETLRLGNVVKFIPRKTIQDVHYQGYDIPRGWKVLPIISAGHLDGSIHKDPQDFNPWRWQNKSASPVEFMPFGGGDHLCAGRELSKMELSVFLHHFILNYRWELGKHDEPLAFPNVEFEKGLPMQVFMISKHDEYQTNSDSDSDSVQVN